MQDDEYRAMFELEERLWWYSGMRAIAASLLAGQVRAGGLRLLDVGCGTGYSMLWLSRLYRSDSMFGVDVSPLATQFWKRRSIKTACLSGAAALALPDQAFDLLTCFDVIYQLEARQVQRALNEFNRVLAHGGLLLIREPAYDWLRGSHDLAVGTHHRFTRPELTKLLLSSGFRIKRATYANTLLLWLALPLRLAWRRAGNRSDVRPVPRAVNRVLELALKMEAALLRHFSFPFGLSVIVLAEKT